MNHATISTYDVRGPEMRLDNMAAHGRSALRHYATARPCKLLNGASGAANRSCFDTATAWQVEEDKGFYIPDFLSDPDYDAQAEAYSIAADHAKHLHRAERLLGEALNLAGLMLVSLGDEGDRRAMQMETALTVIEKKLTKAYNRIDKHDAHHTNLFLAYFDLKGKAEGGESD